MNTVTCDDFGREFGSLAVTSTRRVVVLEAVAKRNKAADNEAALPHLARTQAGLVAAEAMAEAEKAEALAVLFALHPPALRETLELHQDNPCSLV